LKGLLITIEGIDGCGKTTQAKLLYRRMLNSGYETILTHEPTDGRIGTLIERLLKSNEKVAAKLLALLFAADRYEHVENVILPALKSGKVVICDRYYHSSIAYQTSMGLGEDYVRCINDFAPKPDVAIMIRVSSQTSTSRIMKRRRVQYTEQKMIQEKVQQKYDELCKRGELIAIDGEGKRGEVHERIWAIVSEELSKRQSYGVA